MAPSRRRCPTARMSSSGPTPALRTTPRCCGSTTPRSIGIRTGWLDPRRHRRADRIGLVRRGRPVLGLAAAAGATSDESGTWSPSPRLPLDQDPRRRTRRGVHRRHRSACAGAGAGAFANACRAELPQSACRTMHLYVEGDNLAAVHTYQRLDSPSTRSTWRTDSRCSGTGDLGHVAPL